MAGVGGFVVVTLLAISVAGFVMLATTLSEDKPASEVALSLADQPSFRFWATNDDGRPVRWDPCSPIELVINTDRAAYDFAPDLAAAISVVAETTGLDIVIAGETDERPRARRPPYQPDTYGDRWAPVLVAWAEPNDRGLPLTDGDRGLAIPIAVGMQGDRTYVTGQIVLNRRRTDLSPGFGDRADAWGATLLHELGHLVGLAHVADPAQLMAADPGSGPARFAPGDIAGLSHLGADGGCLTVPMPQPIEAPQPSTTPHG